MHIDSAHEDDLADYEHAPGVNESPRSSYLREAIYQMASYRFTRAMREYANPGN